MATIQGYQVTETLYESSKSRVYRGRRDADQKSVILKLLQPDNPSPEAIARFRTEYDIARMLPLESVAQVYRLETHQHTLLLVIEDCGGESLDRYLRNQSLPLETFLKLGIQITQALGEIHLHDIIHKDINPANMVWNSTTEQLQIIDFGLATARSRANLTLLNPTVMEGTLAYMSPEQTGRINRGIDHRTDFYSLGVTLYQMLCDRLPFESTDPMELVHCHLAKQPIPPREVNPEIPLVLSNLVMKLLAKNAEDRYQSAWGIQADLQRALELLRTEGQIPSFTLAQQDDSDRFQLPQKLYGRVQEVETLEAAAERLAQSSPSEFIAISGAAGSGKSALVQAFAPVLAGARGHLVTGKFEPLAQNTPYIAVIQAFQSLLRQLLAEDESQIVIWRQLLLEALGTNGQVILDVIPEVEWMIGKQPSVPDLPPAASSNRFHWVFANFIRVFAQPEHPLAIFLDDLQWADQASLQLIQVLISAPNLHLLWIGAYRTHEVEPRHPLLTTLEVIRQKEAIITSIALNPLAVDDIALWVAEMLNCDRATAQPLAALIHQKTAGSPLFVGEFLKSLYQANLIQFDRQQRAWLWDLTQIQATQLTDSFIALIETKIRNLSASAQQTLSIAACIGNGFESRTIAQLRQRAPEEVTADLWELVQADLIEPLGTLYSPPDNDQFSTAHPWTARFRHDRIQQIAYGLVAEQEAKQIHLQLGQQLLKDTLPEQLEEKIFEIVNHLNLGAVGMTHQAHKDELAHLNLIAGTKAKAAVAYESAFTYFSAGLSLLTRDCWSQDYDLTLQLHSATAEAAYLSGRHEEMYRFITVVLQQAKAPLDRVQVYQIQIQGLIAQNKANEAITIALQALTELGVEIPAQPSTEDLRLGKLQTQRALAGKHTQDLLHLPPMEDPQKLAAMRVISSVCTPTYFTKCQLWQMMVFQKVQLSLNYGNAPGSAFGFADYGMVLCAIDGNFTGGYQFAQLASELLPRLQAKEFVPKTLLLINIYLRHWREHLRATLAPLVEAYQTGLETGDLEYATFAIAFHAYYSYLVGRELPQIESEMAEYGKAIAQCKQAVPLYVNQIYRQVVLNLMGRSEDPCRLVGDSYNEDERLPQYQAEGDRYALFQICLNKLILSYLFQDYAQAVEQATRCERLLAAGATGLLVVPVFYFYNALAKLAHFPNAPQAEQRRILKQVSQSQKQMKTWADRAPMNYLHKYHLIAAEHCRILGQNAQATDHYDRAIALAKDHEYLNEEALAHELATRFYLAQGKSKLAQLYLQDAHYCYRRWGAIAKVQDLETRYAQSLNLAQTTFSGSRLSTSSTTTSSTASSAIDLAAVLQAAQVLSSEIVLERLLTKLMKILIEDAGAEKGCLLLETEGRFCIEAQGSINPDDIVVLQSIPMDSSDVRVSVAMIHYVARTRESVVLDHATQDSKFAHDPYIIQHQPQSVLCAPLLNQGKLTGIVYLENNLTTHAFTSDRLEVIQLLSTQAAISIDNARLYNQLELRVQERTTELTQANQQLEQLTADLQRSNQELEQFAYIASHDLQEPLRTITSYTQKLAQRYQGQLDEKADRYIGFAVDGATRMQQLIQALLTYSRVGRQKLKPEAIDCNTIVSRVLRDLKVVIAESQATLTVAPLPIIQADPIQLSLLFQNLIGNAIKYRSEVPPQIQVSAQKEPECWRFSIHDNGIGIESQYCDRIFKIFQRLHTSDEYPGTGLGLAICQKIVENHGGHIWVESKLGAGSTFSFEIPESRADG
jgi:predicted ATPase/signal transduction histidine kinase